jgi:radical SAM superfamily enzyme YgiQ (UPF0313 family)
MNALLIYPACPETFWSFKSVLKYVSKKAAFPPLGLLTLGAMLPAQWEVRLVDENVAPLGDKDIEWADMVFVSAMIVQRESAKTALRRCRDKGKTIVAGGPMFNTLYKEFPEVDHFVLGEAEATLPLFLADLEAGAAEPLYTSDERPPMTLTPIPAWHLLRLKDYVSMSVQYSRGCPFNCEFCDIVIMNGRIPRTKPARQLLAEIESLYQAGWRGGLFIVDDNFIGNAAKVKAMLPALIEWQKQRRYPFQLFTEASVNLADDPELMRLMSAANFNKVFLGIETPETDSLKESGKYQNINRDLAETVLTIQAHGMQVMGGFIVGFDSDTQTTFEAQVRFIQQAGIVTAMVGVLNALPLTRLWCRLRDEQRLLDAPMGENTAAHLNFVPAMGRKSLLDGYRHVIANIYSRPMYYRRIRTFLQNYTPTAHTRTTLNDLHAFLKSMLLIGMFSRASFLYWRLLIRTVLTKRRALPMVVELMICGQHFFRMRKRLKA